MRHGIWVAQRFGQIKRSDHRSGRQRGAIGRQAKPTRQAKRTFCRVQRQGEPRQPHDHRKKRHREMLQPPVLGSHSLRLCLVTHVIDPLLAGILRPQQQGLQHTYLTFGI